MKKILVIFGTRPEAIKMAPVIFALKKDANFNVQICVTGQHRELLDQVLALFRLRPDYDLDIMKKNQNLGAVTSKLIESISDVLQLSEPDLVLVHGDTTTTFCAALASYYNKIDVGHVEAGLRTGDNYSPFPEEINRRLTGNIAKYHFAPTPETADNLLKEGVSRDNIIITGNTVVDSLMWVKSNLLSDNKIVTSLDEKFKFLSKEKNIILVTGHRRESFGEGFQNICIALREIKSRFENTQIIYPVHPNPNVLDLVNEELSGIEGIHLIDPCEYLSFCYLMDRSKLILTDSGGIQEEAPSLGKPVLVMRNNTERKEAVNTGTVKLVGTNPNTIVSEVAKLLNDEVEYRKMSMLTNPYGDGTAAQKIKSALVELLH